MKKKSSPSPNQVTVGDRIIGSMSGNGVPPSKKQKEAEGRQSAGSAHGGYFSLELNKQS